MTDQSRFTRLLCVAVAVVALGACGWKTDVADPVFSSPRMDAGRRAPDLGSPDVGVDTGVDRGVDVGPECVPFRSIARLATLDVLLIADSSGSMAQPTDDADVTKWQALTGALSRFFEVEGSAGASVELFFFPLVRPDVPALCSSDDECGSSPDGRILPGVCEGIDLVFCRTSADCPDEDECRDAGRCDTGSDERILLCFDPDGCSRGQACLEFGFCDGQTVCEDEAYARPAVPLAELPGAAPALVDALESREVDGGTPTLPALRGIIERARRRLVESPGSQAVVFLATDGFPGSCDPAVPWWGPRVDAEVAVTSVAEVAADGLRSGVETYVIGVFNQDQEDAARANLSTIADAGGTDEAFIVTTDSPVEERLLQVLEDLRDDVQACVYAVPAPGGIPDPEDLAVTLLDPAAPPRPLERRDDAEACDPVFGGFFFDRELGDGVRPGSLELCPVSCALAERPEVEVEISGTCE